MVWRNSFSLFLLGGTALHCTQDVLLHNQTVYVIFIFFFFYGRQRFRHSGHSPGAPPAFRRQLPHRVSGRSGSSRGMFSYAPRRRV